MSQHQILINRSVEVKRYKKFEVYTVNVNTIMAGAWIVCPIYMVNLVGARSDLVAYWFEHRTLEPADQGRFLGWHLLYIIFLFFIFQLYNAELLRTSNMNLYK